jgi:hypothetical protein
MELLLAFYNFDLNYVFMFESNHSIKNIYGYGIIF